MGGKGRGKLFDKDNFWQFSLLFLLSIFFSFNLFHFPDLINLREWTYETLRSRGERYGLLEAA